MKLKDIILKYLVFALSIIFVFILFLLSGLVNSKGDMLFLAYGSLIIIYLLTKIILSFVYKPYTEQVKTNLKIDAVIPTYNENSANVIELVDSLMVQTYPINKIFIIDDATPDREEVEKMVAYFETNKDKYPNVNIYLKQVNAGKREAQEIAFRLSDADAFLTTDSDTYIYPNALEEMVKTFNDTAVMAVTGHINVRNKMDNLLTILIDTRYDNAFRTDRAGQSVTGVLVTCSGPLSLYRREVVVPNLDRYVNQMFLGDKVIIGDDRALTSYALELGKVVYQSTAKATTDAPTKLKDFLKQQLRWNRSFLRETLLSLKGHKNFTLRVWAFVEACMWLVSLIFVSKFILIFNEDATTAKYLLLIYFLTIMMSAYARSVHYIKKHPFLFLLAPLYGIIHLFMLIPLRLYALLTIKQSKSWNTRTLVTEDKSNS